MQLKCFIVIITINLCVSNLTRLSSKTEYARYYIINLQEQNAMWYLEYTCNNNLIIE